MEQNEIWGLPTIGVPLNHLILDGIFPYKTSSYGGYPHSRKPPYWEVVMMGYDGIQAFQTRGYLMGLNHIKPRKMIKFHGILPKKHVS